MRPIHKKESSWIFGLYLLYVTSYLLRFTARVEVLGVIRFDMLLAGVLFLAMFLQVSKAKENFNHPISKSLYAICIYVVLTIPLVEWPGSVLKSNLIPYIKAILFFFFTIAFVNTPSKLKKIIFVYVLCQTIRVLEPLYLNLTEGYWGSGTHIGGGQFASRLSGSPVDVVNPNGLAFVICIAWAYWHYFVWQGGSLSKKLIYLLVAGAFGYAMILSMSRSGLVALFVLFFLIVRDSKHKAIIFTSIIVMCSFAFTQMSDIQRDRVLSLTGNSESSQGASAQGRVNFMFRMGEVWLNRPIVGHGLGTSKEAGANFGEDAKIAHSIYFEVLIELGIIGFCIFLRFIFNVKNAILHIKRSIKESDKFNYSLAQVLHSLLWVYLIFSIAYFGFSRSWWYFLAGIVVVQAGFVKANDKEGNNI